MNKFNPAIHHRRSIRLKGYDYSQNGLYFITICCQNRVCRFGYIENKEMILNEYGKIAYNEWIKLAERFPNFELDVFQIMPNHMHGIIVLNNKNTSVGSGLAPDQTIENRGNGQPQGIAPTTDPTIDQTIEPTDDKNQRLGDTNGRSEGIIPDNGRPQGIAPTIDPTIDPTDDKIQVIAPPNRQPQGIAPTTDPTNAPTISDIVGAYKSIVANGCLEIFKSKNQTMGKLWQRDFYEHIIRNQQAYLKISEYIINNPAKWNEDLLNKK